MNAASYASAAVGNNVIAQGSIFSVFGTNVGPTASPALAFPLATSLGGVSVRVSGASSVDAIPLFVGPSQINAIMPSNAPIGDASVTVTFNGQTSGAVKITVVKTQVGIFTANSGGTGPAAAQHGSDSSAVLLTAASQPGEVVVLYGTGLGAISGPDNVAPGAVQFPSVTVTVAGKVITPDYAGRSPSLAGLDQINFKLPADVATGCYVPASITAGGQVSQDFVLSIAASGSSTCVHPLGLSRTDMLTLDAGGTVNIGLFQVLRAFLAAFGGSVEGAGGLFNTVNANGVFQMYNRIPVAFGSVPYPAPLNGCVVIDQVNTGSGFSVPDFGLIGGKELLADSLILNVDGPGGHANVLRQDTGGYLGVFLPPILAPGSWTISGTGGTDVKAFSAKITLPDNLDWSNRGNIVGTSGTVVSGDINITWTGGTTAGSPVVTVFGNSTVVNAKDPSKTRAKSFYCAAPASARSLLVPASVRQQLPSSSTADGETAFGSLGITTGGFASFNAPLSNGTLNSGTIAYGEAIVLSVKFQ